MGRDTRLRYDLGFRRFWAACTISDLGTSVTTVALGVLVVSDLHGTAAEVGLVRGAAMVPYLVFGLFVGVLVDRIRRKPVLVSTDLGRAVVLAGVPVLAGVGDLTIPTLAVLMALFGTLSVLSTAAQQSFLPVLVPRPLLPRANARLEQSTAVAQTAGPVVGGALVAGIGAPLAVALDAVSYALSGLLIAASRVPEPAPSRSRRSVLEELREGTRWVYRHPTLRPLTLSTHGWFLFNAIATTVYVPFALRELGFGGSGAGCEFRGRGSGGGARYVRVGVAEPPHRNPGHGVGLACVGGGRVRRDRFRRDWGPCRRCGGRVDGAVCVRLGFRGGRADRDLVPPGRHACPVAGQDERDGTIVQPRGSRHRRAAWRVRR